MKGLNFEEVLIGKKILVLIPHPDDEIIGVGGTMALLKGTNTEVDCVCISSSGIPTVDGKYTAKSRNEARIQEWHSVMKRLGVHKEYINSTYGDNFPFLEKLKNDTPEIISHINPKEYDFIFVPSFFENHVEHRFLTYTFLPKLLRKGRKRGQNIVLDEVWSLISTVTDYVDISNYIDEKMELLRMYKTQCDYVDYDVRVKGLNLYRGHMGGRVQYAEAFWVMKTFTFKIIAFGLNIALNIKKICRKLRGR